MSALEHELIERISRLDEEQQRKVLEYIQIIEGALQERYYSATELMQLPPNERSRLIAAAFERAANEDFETFEAYSEEDIDDPS
jgi:hypothetical protein